jgi:trk system potassium uptake protein
MKVLIIGAGYFGQNLAISLVEKKQEVIVIDKVMNKLTVLRDTVSKAIQLDATDKEMLAKVVPSKVDQAIVSIGRNIEANLIVSLLLKEIGVEKITAKCHSSEHKKILKMIGIDVIVDPEKEMAETLADRIVKPDILDHLPLESDYKIVKVMSPKAFVDKKLKELDVRNKYSINIIGLKQKQTDGSYTFNMTPGGDTIIQSEDMLITIGKEKDIENFIKQ